MSYLSVSKCVDDVDLSNRVRACFADEGGDAAQVPPALFWAVATADDIEAAYASAIAANHPRPGADEAVITDAMILGVVQANWPPAP